MRADDPLLLLKQAQKHLSNAAELLEADVEKLRALERSRLRDAASLRDAARQVADEAQQRE